MSSFLTTPLPTLRRNSLTTSSNLYSQMTQNYPGVAQPQKIIELNEALKPQLNCMLHLSAASECEEQQTVNSGGICIWAIPRTASELALLHFHRPAFLVHRSTSLTCHSPSHAPSSPCPRLPRTTTAHTSLAIQEASLNFQCPDGYCT